MKSEKLLFTGEVCFCFANFGTKIDNLQCIFLEPTAARSSLLIINMRESEKAIASGCRQHVRVI